MFKTIHLQSTERQTLINVTDDVKAVIQESGISDGIVLVYCHHSTAGLVVNSYLDPATPKDIVHELDRVIPTRVDFFHQFDTPSDASAHVKATITGTCGTFILHEGKRMLGRSQGILFAEFDGPRPRSLFVKVVAG